MGILNVFRILGDTTHSLSKCILIWSIHSNKSAEGVSLITQVLYAVVFCTRYLDIFWNSVVTEVEIWNFVLKIAYISSSLYIVFIMLHVYARTREREKAWRFGGACLAGSLLLAPVVMGIFVAKHNRGLWRLTWTFSEILESVCVLPQLLLLRQTSVPTVIDSFYLVTLGSYRAFYILNWIERYVTEKDPRTGRGHFDPTAVVFGILQVLFYLDFAWVYWTRQRVKLRNGGVVDAEDLGRGFLVSKVLGRSSADVEANGRNDEPSGRVSSRRGWGARGISVSADEGVTGSRPVKNGQTMRRPNEQESEGMLQDPDEFSDLEDLEDRPPLAHDTEAQRSIGNGDEWRNESTP